MSHGPSNPSRLEISPVERPIEGVVRPPGSKSITNRALICAALAEGDSTLNGALASEDTQVMLDALAKLGIVVESRDSGQTLVVHGCAGTISAPSAELFVANSGTSMRFLTALVSLAHGRFRLSGTPRMHQRPIGDLLDALAQLNVKAASESPGGCPPVVVEADGLVGGRATIRGDVSSQFLSGLLMAAPYARQPMEIVIEGPLVSQPYVRMTLAVMAAFGVAVQADDLSTFRADAPQQYHGRQYAIEPDASAASYFWAAAAVTGGRVTVAGLGPESLQGDVGFVRSLEAMGCRVEKSPAGTTVIGGPLRGIDADMNSISDTVQTLAAVALFAKGPTTIRGVAHIRHKETDRIAALAAELRKLGALVDELDDGLCITPGALHGAEIATYDDHRMAMSLALVGLAIPGVVILDPGCTAKTYPHYFDDLSRLCGGTSA